MNKLLTNFILVFLVSINIFLIVGMLGATYGYGVYDWRDHTVCLSFVGHEIINIILVVYWHKNVNSIRIMK